MDTSVISDGGFEGM